MAENVEYLMPEIRLAYFVFNRRALKTVPILVKMFLERLRELLGQNRAWQEFHAVPKPEVDRAVVIKDEDEEAVVCTDPRPVKRSRSE